MADSKYVLDDDYIGHSPGLAVAGMKRMIAEKIFQQQPDRIAAAAIAAVFSPFLLSVLAHYN